MTDDSTPKPPHEPRADVDARLRGAFEPEPDVAVRVARAALATGAGRPMAPDVAASAPVRRIAGLRWVGVAAAAAIIVLAASLALQPANPATSFEPAPAADGTPSLTGSFTDGVLVVSLPDGSFSILGGGAREDRPPDGYGFVLVEGELR